MVPGDDGEVSPPVGMVVDGMIAAFALLPIAIEAADSPVIFSKLLIFIVTGADFVLNQIWKIHEIKYICLIINKYTCCVTGNRLFAVLAHTAQTGGTEGEHTETETDLSGFRDCITHRH